MNTSSSSLLGLCPSDLSTVLSSCVIWLLLCYWCSHLRLYRRVRMLIWTIKFVLRWCFPGTCYNLEKSIIFDCGNSGTPFSCPHGSRCNAFACRPSRACRCLFGLFTRVQGEAWWPLIRLSFWRRIDCRLCCWWQLTRFLERRVIFSLSWHFQLAYLRFYFLGLKCACIFRYLDWF